MVKDAVLCAQYSPYSDTVKSGIDLKLTPVGRPFRTVDKHGQVHYCYNLAGRAPNMDVNVPIGTEQDDAPVLEASNFKKYV
jgi:hypothetical protein